MCHRQTILIAAVPHDICMMTDLDSSVDGHGGDTLVSGGRRRDGMIVTRSQGRGDGSQLRKVMAIHRFLAQLLRSW